MLNGGAITVVMLHFYGNHDCDDDLLLTRFRKPGVCGPSVGRLMIVATSH